MARKRLPSQKSAESSTITSRRKFMATGGATIAFGLSGCSGGDDADDTPVDDVDDTTDADTVEDTADGEYPTRQIRWIIPSSPGGGSDTWARIMQPHMERELGVRIRMENIAGAATMRALNEGYAADPDGYTIVQFNPPSSPLTELLEPQDFDCTEFEGVGQFSNSPYVMFGNGEYVDEYGVEDMLDVIELFQEGEFSTWGVIDLGSISHIQSLLAREQWGLEFEEVIGYTSGPHEEALVSGELPFALRTEAGHEDYVESGDLVPLGVITNQGSNVFPEIPTPEELELADISFIGALNRCLFMAPGTSDEHVQVISDALQSTLQEDQVVEWSEGTGNPIVPSGPEDADQLVEDAYEQIPQAIDLDDVREDL